MKNYQYILFDLDGTLTNSELGITNSVKYALEKSGYEIPDGTVLRKFIGPPLVYSFVNFCGMSEEEAVKAVVYYREVYSVTGIFESVVYEGIEETLKALKVAGKELLVATSKPEYYARKIVKHFGLDTYFDFVAGASMDKSRAEKDQVIAYALEEYGIRDKQNVIMIGDRKHDIEGAKVNGVDSMGVLFGFGDKEELENAGADYIAKSAKDILMVLD